MILTFVLGRGVPQTIYRSTSKFMPVANEIFPEAEEASTCMFISIMVN